MKKLLIAFGILLIPVLLALIFVLYSVFIVS